MIDRISPPLTHEDDPQRPAWCELALYRAFEELTQMASASGWQREEIAWALIGLADRNMQMVLNDIAMIEKLTVKKPESSRH